MGLPPLKSVVVIGAGIVGLCCAWYLSEAGFEVTVVERGPEGGDNCSQGNSGMIVPSHFAPLASPGMIGYGLKQLFRSDSPFGISNPFDSDFAQWSLLFAKATSCSRHEEASRLLLELQLASKKLYLDLESALGTGAVLNKNGLLSIALSARQLEKEAEAAETARRLGLEVAVLSANETRALDPAIDMHLSGAVHYRQDACLDPSAFTSAIRRRLHHSGTAFAWSASIDKFETRQGRLTSISSDTERFRSDWFVMAPGASLSEIAKPLGLRMPLLSGKGYSLDVLHSSQSPTVCALVPERRLAMTPMSNWVRFGGTMELGLEGQSVNRTRVDGILEAIAEVYPRYGELDLESAPIWVGNRPCTPDGLPYLGRTVSFDNLIVAAGHAMSGVSLAPITGKLVTQHILGEKPPIDHRFLHPDRYA